jgi:hypothetical protein
LQRCGIARVNQSTTQRQPRLPDNSLPPGFSGPPTSTPSPPPPMPTSNSSGSIKDGTPQSNIADVSNLSASSVMPPQSIMNDKNIRPFMIALLTINAVFVVGTLTALFIYIARKRGSSGRRQPDHRPLHLPTTDKDHDREHEYYDPYTGPTQ